MMSRWSTIGFCFFVIGQSIGAQALTALEDAQQSLSLFTPADVPPPTCRLLEKANLRSRTRKVALERTFHDGFENLDLRAERWTPHSDGNYDWPVKRHFKQAGQQQFFVDENFKGSASKPLGINPFRLNNGILSIVGDKTPSDLVPLLYNFEYTSGLLTTRRSFVQTFGYFEVRAKIPAGQGVWPAFWLLPENKFNWPPEIDVLEGRGQTPGSMAFTVHWKEIGTGAQKSTQCNMVIADAPSVFHNYGVLWEKERLTYFVDREAVAELASPPGFEMPMYMIVNLGLGSTTMGGIGKVDGRTHLPVLFEIDRIDAYAIRDAN